MKNNVLDILRRKSTDLGHRYLYSYLDGLIFTNLWANSVDKINVLMIFLYM